jgi:hypothetical protein
MARDGFGRLRRAWRAQLAVTLLGAAIAREAHASPSVWVIDDGEKIRRDATATPFERGEHNPVWSPGQPVRLFAMRNESVALQVVVEADADPLASVTVELPRLDAPDGSVIPIERFVEHFVDVRRASTGARDTVSWVGPVPDALIPVDSAPAWDPFPMRVAPRTNGIVWIDVDVPRAAVPGTYRGTIDVRDGGRALADIPVELEVAGPALPDRMSGAMVYYDAHNLGRRTGKAASEQSLWMVLHEHRIAALHNAMTAADVVRQIDALDGSLYTRARGYLGPAQGVGDGVLSLGAYGDLGDPRRESIVAVEQMARAASDAKLWESTEVFLYAIDERCDSPRAGAWRALLRGSSDATLRRVLVAQTCTRDPSAQPVDVAMLNAAWDEGRVRAARTLGKDVWVYDGAEPHTGTFRLDADAISPRVNGWLAAMFGVPRWFDWEATYWYGRHDAHPVDPFVEAETFHDDDGDFENGGGVLVYPGEQVDAFQEHSVGVAGVIPSVRLKNWRRGVEDGAYLEMARTRDAKKADAVSTWLIPAAFGAATDDDAPSWGARGDRFFQARRALLAIVTGRDPGPLGAAAPEWVAQSETRVRWRLGGAILVVIAAALAATLTGMRWGSRHSTRGRLGRP